MRAHVTSRNSARFSTWPACQWYPERSFTSDVKQEIYISSPRPPVTIPDKPFAEFMLSTIKQYGDLTALVGLQFDYVDFIVIFRLWIVTANLEGVDVSVETVSS